MKVHLKITSLLVVMLFMTGCSKAMVKSDSDPNADLTKLETFYVHKLADDDDDLDQIIASKLNEFGFQATSGPSPRPGHAVDTIVTYKDRWMWDITMYLLEIDIEFHDPESDFVFASGKSYRTSLVRKPPEYMIEEVLRDLFAGKVELPEKEPEETTEENPEE